MENVYYEVQATFEGDAVARRWVGWLRTEHLAEVMACGAMNGRVVQLDEPALTYAAQYEFESRAAFDRYLREDAPRLRATGLERFPHTVVTYARRSGEIVERRQG